MATTSFQVGDLFASCKDLEDKIHLFIRDNYVELWKRDSWIIAGVRKRRNRKMKPELKYYELIFFCIHGGKTFKRDREYHLM